MARDTDSVTIEHLWEMAAGVSNGQVTGDATWPVRSRSWHQYVWGRLSRIRLERHTINVKVIPIYWDGIILKCVRDSTGQSPLSLNIILSVVYGHDGLFCCIFNKAFVNSFFEDLCRATQVTNKYMRIGFIVLWALRMTDRLPSVHWCCWLGHRSCKKPISQFQNSWHQPSWKLL